MPRHKHSTSKPVRKQNAARKTARISKAKSARKPKPLSPRGIILRRSDDIIAKVRALQKLGIYKPRKPISRKTITRSQKRRALAHFSELQKHGHIKNGIVTRPLKRTMKGYVLTNEFKLARGNVKRSSPGVIKTRKGAIVEGVDGKKVKIEKDGSITTTVKIDRITRKTKTRVLSAAEGHKFIDDALNGKVKIPKGKMLRLAIFGNFINTEEIDNTEGLRTWATKYSDKLLTAISKYPKHVAPFTVETINTLI